MRKYRRSWYSDLFFSRRRPHIVALPRDWERPADDDDYQRLIHNDGFLSPKYWSDGDLRQYPTILDDAEDLAEYLLPTYFEYAQKSKYYQDRFYFYQWVFIVGVFLSVVFSLLALANFTSNSYLVGNFDIRAFFIILSLIISTLTAFTFFTQREDLRTNWIRSRRLTELLRMNYFKYLSHLLPFDLEDRLDKLRDFVVTTRLEEQNKTLNTQKNGLFLLEAPIKNLMKQPTIQFC